MPDIIIRSAARILPGLTNGTLLKSGNVNGRRVAITAIVFVTNDLLVEVAETLRKYSKIIKI
jgi:hypothetical protein